MLNKIFCVTTTTINGKTIKIDNKVQKGDEILTKTANFNIKSTVIDTEEEKHLN